jgi:hypothetical protein
MVWFSYYPRFDFGADSTMYFKLTVPLAYVLVLSIIGISRIWRERSRLMRQPAVWLLVGFILWQGISLLWTPNVLRGGLTLGISGMLGLVFAACLASVSRIKKLLPALARLYIITALIMGCLAVLQLILGVWLSRQDTLLCAGCVADQFGFVRPNVFAIEPQFFGSMLLVPLLILVHVSMSERQSWRVWLSLGFLSTVLVLTLSRGALFAFLVGVIVLLLTGLLLLVILPCLWQQLMPLVQLHWHPSLHVLFHYQLLIQLVLLRLLVLLQHVSVIVTMHLKHLLLFTQVSLSPLVFEQSKQLLQLLLVY